MRPAFHVDEGGDVGRRLDGLALGEGPKTPTTEHPFSREQVERDLGDLTGREADDEEAAVPRHRSEGRLAEPAAHRVVDDVGAGPTGQLSHSGLEILLGVVDRHRRTVRQTASLDSVGGGDHRRP
jgi:hypothetical protein